jgi:tRNA pseudouridine55 synthase
MTNGWIILDKPIGLGSTQAVAAVKRNLRQAGLGKAKVGHGGTLDPLASGILPIAVGEATKLCGRMLDASKEYAFTIRFGSETDTLDLEGSVIAESVVRPTLAGLRAVLPRFTGPIEQVPPAYSALMVDGQRAYDRARAGETVELKARAVTVHALDILAHGRNRSRRSPRCARLEGHLHPQPRARYRAGAGHGRACHHAAPPARRPVRAGSRDFAGQIERCG